LTKHQPESLHKTQRGQTTQPYFNKFLVGSSLFSLAQTVTEPYGDGSVVFGSTGGKWQRAVITDQLTGESSTAYSLDAETQRQAVNENRVDYAFVGPDSCGEALRPANRLELSKAESVPACYGGKALSHPLVSN
jgi:hypothetical protein